MCVDGVDIGGESESNQQQCVQHSQRLVSG
jgi:hypothetical protein